MPSTPRGRFLRARIATLALLLMILIPLGLVVARWLNKGSATPSFSAGDVTEIDKVIQSESSPEISFWDGSRVTLEAHTKARVVTVAEPRVEVRLEEGTAHFYVETGNERDWIASAGPFRMYVQSADFRMTWSPSLNSFELQFNSGSAELLSACGQSPHRLRDKTTLQLLCVHPKKASSLPEPAKTLVNPNNGGQGRGGASSEESPLTWKELAAQGNYDAAFAKSQKTALDVQCKTWPAEDLTQAADLAGLAKDLRTAESLLRCVRDRFAREDAAPNAAFRLGRLLAETRPDEAAKWFGTYEKERPNGDLVAEALGRQMDASSRAGDASGARHVAEKYLERFATGPYAAQANSLLKR
ncbi:MAG: hypothetical protein SFV15_02190 [Polyangiaceae bacterium]|nr:hypothetical protein [Polyangiaceae bacterium]